MNVKDFTLIIDSLPPIGHFRFPNLTAFKFSTCTFGKPFPVSQLLDFLQDSPALQRINMYLHSDRFNEDVPPERVVVLPHVKTFCLSITNPGPGCEITTHISCPFATRAKFEHGLEVAGCRIPKNMYPPLVPWNAIVHQYTKGTVEGATIKITVDRELTLSCQLTFRSSDGAALELEYTHHSLDTIDDMNTVLDRYLPPVFSKASRAIRDHPLLANVRYLNILGGKLPVRDLGLAANDVGKLLGSLGMLEQLTLEGCDLRPYLDAFLAIPLFPDAIQPTSFPPIKVFSIIDPIQSLYGDGVYADAIVKLARSQHTREIPFQNIRLPLGVPSNLYKVLKGYCSQSMWEKLAMGHS